MAGRAKARQRLSSTRLCRLKAIARAALAAQTLAVQRGADHARVVEHQRVAGAQQVGQVADDAVVEPVPSPRKRGEGRRPHHQQPRGIARDGGLQRDALVGQVEVEEVGAHDRGLTQRAGPLYIEIPSGDARAQPRRSLEAC